MFIFLHSITTNIRTIRREVFEYSNNIRIFKVARIRIRIVIFVKNYSNIRIIRIFVTTLACMHQCCCLAIIYIPLLGLSMSAAALGLVFLLLTIFSFVFVYISYGKLGSKGTGKKLEGVICL